MLTETPVGLDGIINVFGPVECVAPLIARFDLPYTLFFEGKPVNHASCHKLIVDNFIKAFETIKELGLTDQCQNYGGIFAQRSIRGQSAHASTHSWGIAIDLEPQKYPLGSSLRFPDPIIKAFTDAGFFYGGDFKSRKDGQHFQYAVAY